MQTYDGPFPFRFDDHTKRCLNCDEAPIKANQIFCDRCGGNTEPCLANPTKVDILSNLSENQIVYVRQSDFFEADGSLWILSDTVFAPEQDPYSTVRVRMNRHGSIEALFADMDRDAIYMGYPEDSGHTPFLIVHLVNNFK